MAGVSVSLGEASLSLKGGWAGQVHLKEEKEPGGICKGIREEEAGSTIPREALSGMLAGMLDRPPPQPAYQAGPHGEPAPQTGILALTQCVSQ